MTEEPAVISETISLTAQEWGLVQAAHDRFGALLVERVAQTSPLDPYFQAALRGLMAWANMGAQIDEIVAKRKGATE